jgi:hypothetical protein
LKGVSVENGTIYDATALLPHLAFAHFFKIGNYFILSKKVAII